MKAEQKEHLEELRTYYFKKGNDIGDEGVEFLFELIDQQIMELSGLTTIIGSGVMSADVEIGYWQLISSEGEVCFVHKGKTVAKLTKDGKFFATEIKGGWVDVLQVLKEKRTTGGKLDS